jgi:hypothetical protein
MRADRNAVRNTVAKRLRKIARSFGLERETKYAPGGKLRRRWPPRPDHNGVMQPGPPIPRPFVLRACERLVYKHAKQAYKGKPLSILQPEPEPKPSNQPKEFRENVAESARAYAQV